MNYTTIPSELKTRNQWVLWKYETRSPIEKPTKVPYQPNGKHASHADPSTWSRFDDVILVYERGQYGGIGFVFSEDDEYIGIDLDNCAKPGVERIQSLDDVEDWARQFLFLCASYAEVSPSGKGVKIWLKGVMPSEKGRKKAYQTGAVEMYSHHRFFTVTGQHLDGTPTTINHNTDAIVKIYLEVFGSSRDESEKKTASKPSSSVTDDDRELIEKAMNAYNGDKFRSLWEGNWEAAGYNSHSEADLALCSMLAFWTGGDATRIDSLFRQSKLYRDKWERDDYRMRTIAKALTQAQSYDPNYQSGKQSQASSNTKQQDKPDAGSAQNGSAGASQNDEDYFPYTDYGNARRLVAQHGRDLRYIDDWGRWYVWNGKHWKRDNNREIVRRAKETVRAMYAEASKIVNDEQRKAFVKWTRGSESKSRLEAMIELAKSEPGIPIAPDELDTAGMLLNVKNGTLDLRTGELRKHRREDLIGKIAPAEYQPDAKCPLWLSFLDRIMDGNQNLIDFLQRAVGYSLTGETSEHCLFFMYGTGRNGKTTFIETIRALLGDYAQKAPTEMLMKKKYEGGIPNDVARLPGARLVVVAEVEEGRRLSESIVKDLTGGDTLTARFLRQEFFDFEPTHKIWMYGNYRPVVRGTDEGIWSRIPLIPFTVFIPPKERDPDLRNKLRAELPGILRWAVEGCLQWQKNGLNLPDEVVKATKEYRDEMDDLADFISECCVIHENAWVTSNDLWNAYQEWAKAGGEQYPLGRRAFANRQTARGFVNKPEKIGDKNLRVWRGIGLAAEPKTAQSKTDYEEGVI